MAKEIDRPSLASPAVVAGITPMAKFLAAGLRGRFCERLGGVPRPFRMVQLSNEFETEIRSTLTKALNIRHLDNPFAMPAGGDVRRRGPQVVLAAAAAELPDGSDPIAQAAAAIRHEFRRSALDGRLALLVYVGPVHGRLPDQRVLEQLETLVGLDDVFVFSDGDAQGRRMRPRDAVTLAAQFLFYYFTSDSLQSFVAGLSPISRSAPRRVAVGTGRMDLAEKAVRDHLRRVARARLFEHLFHRAGAAAKLPAHPGRITPQIVRGALKGSCGSVSAVGEMAGPTSQVSADRLLCARLAGTADATRQAILALAPPPGEKRPSWWVWLICWLLWPARLIGKYPERAGAWCSRRGPASAVQPPKPTPEELLPQLIESERICMRIKRLELAMEPVAHVTNNNPPSPLEVALGQIPRIADAFEQLLPETEQLAWELTRSGCLDSLMSEDFDPAEICRRVDALCDRMLKLDQRGRLLRPEMHFELVRHALSCVAPAFPHTAGPISRLALVPAPIADQLDFAGCETHAGCADEIFFAVVQPVPTLLPFPDHPEIDDGDEQPGPPAVM